MRDKIKRALAIVLSLVSSFIRVKSLDRDYGPDDWDNDLEAEDVGSNCENKGKPRKGKINLWIPGGLTFVAAEEMVRRYCLPGSNVWDVIDETLKSFFDERLNYIQNHPDLYNDIDSYVPPANSDLGLIDRDVGNGADLPGIDSVVITKLKLTLRKVLRYAYGKSNAPYFQGYHGVCLGILYMIQQCYPTLADNTICKLGVDLYSHLVPALNSYSKLNLSFLKEREVPEFFKNKFQDLVTSYGEDNTFLVLDIVMPQIHSGFGAYLICLGQSTTLGGRLIKDLLLYSCGKITKEELESEMANVTYKYCKECLDKLIREDNLSN